MEAFEDHDDILVPHDWMRHIKKHWTYSDVLPHTHIHIYVKAVLVFPLFVQLLEKRVARGTMLLLEQYLEFVPDHFLSQQLFNHRKEGGNMPDFLFWR